MYYNLKVVIICMKFLKKKGLKIREYEFFRIYCLLNLWRFGIYFFWFFYLEVVVDLVVLLIFIGYWDIYGFSCKIKNWFISKIKIYDYFKVCSKYFILDL